MTGPDDSHDPDIEAISSELSEGLEACRSMVNDYRSALRKTSGAGDYSKLDVSSGDARKAEQSEESYRS